MEQEELKNIIKMDEFLDSIEDIVKNYKNLINGLSTDIKEHDSNLEEVNNNIKEFLKKEDKLKEENAKKQDDLLEKITSLCKDTNKKIDDVQSRLTNETDLKNAQIIKDVSNFVYSKCAKNFEKETQIKITAKEVADELKIKNKYELISTGMLRTIENNVNLFSGIQIINAKKVNTEDFEIIYLFNNAI